MKQINEVNIRPSVSILSALRHLNYKPWFALAEFVDNAVDSYLKNKKELEELEKDFKLKVFISINSTENKISIIDNAAGIYEKDFERALKTAEMPPITTGLSEFGMGMKSAACWFSNFWLVKTTALTENIERTVVFDVNKIVKEQLEILDVKSSSAELNEHTTTIELHEVHNIPKRRTLSKIKEHLASIYRDFFRQGILELYLNDELLAYDETNILVAPLDNRVKVSNEYEHLYHENVIWKLQIPEDFEIRAGLIIEKGFVSIREVGSTEKAGLALFRRGRVILGSGDEGFRPQELFGSPNSFRYQRVFGELHLKGFDVSHTKDGFKNDDDIQQFIKILSDILNEDSFPLLRQAEGYRKKPTNKDYKKSATQIVKDTVDKVKQNIDIPVKQIIEQKREQENFEQVLASVDEDMSSYETFEIKFLSVDWVVDVELSWNDNFDNWLEIGDKFTKRYEQENPKLYRNVRNIGIRLALKHPFCEKYASTDKTRITPLLRLAVAIGMSEIVARENGVPNSSFFRNNINKLLTDALS
jgi:hypothetical protein